MTGRFAATVLKHDAQALATLSCVTEAANDSSFNWQGELDNDPEYLIWLDERAAEEEMRHANW